MGPQDAIHFATVEEWGDWLERNHAEAPEVWVLYYKKHTGRPSIAWAEAVEQALRFGWIDGLVNRIDEDRYAQRWTPRRPTSKWSKVNVATAERLIAEGRMAPAGLESVRIARERGAWEKAYSPTKALPVPPALRDALASAPEARERWRRLTVTWRNRCVERVEAARTKKEAAARIARIVASLQEGTRPDLG